MESGLPRRLLSFARELQRAASFGELLDATRAEVSASIGYQRVWFFVADHEDAEEVRLIDVAGPDFDKNLIWSVAPVLKIKGLKRVLPETIAVDLIPGARLPLVEADASQLDQVFMNLCINARDAMPAGGRLTLETEQVVINGAYAATHPWAQPGRYVLITVTDTGIGMSRDILERIFEPFFTTKREQQGTGLGLAVCYGIVRQHGGMLNCYSEVNVGTTFKIYLPVLSRAVRDVGDKIQGAVAAGRERILDAEDDPSVRLVVRRILERAGYTVVAAENGEAACQVAAGEAFDLVLLDVVMPGMTCQAALERLHVLMPNARFLLSSGYTAETNVAALLQGSAHELLRKPYDPDRLLRAIRRILDAPATA